MRDLLRKVLQDVQGICLYEEKPSVYPETSPRNSNLGMIANWVQVEQNLLYYYLSDLEDCRQDTDATLDHSTLEHLDLLLDFIRTAYASTTERLSPLLEKHQITYDLL